MRPNLIKATDEISARARADRSIQSARVVAVDTVSNTAILDIGMVDFNGNPVYMHGVPFSPQTPPQVNDTVPIVRTSSSPYSCVIGAGAQVGGANSGQVVQAGGAVTSIRKVGEATGQQGDIIFAAGTGISVLRANKTFSIGLTNTGVVPGAYTDVNLTVDATGRVVNISNGSGGGGGGPSGFAPSNMHFVTTQAESQLSNEFSLGSLASGLLKHTVSGSVSTPATATLGADYAGAPDGSTLETSGGTTRIKDAGVTLAKLANIADQTILGNNTGGAAAPLALTPSQVRTLLALVIGTNVQAWDADLDALAALTATTNNFIQSKSSAWASRTPTQVTADLIAFIGDSGSGGTKGLVPAPGAGDAAANKFLKADGTFDVPSGSGAPTTAHYVTTQAESGLSAEFNLGGLTTGLLKHAVSGSVSTPATATEGTDYYAPGGTDVAVTDGGTGSSTASGARTNLGLAIGTDVQAHDGDLDTIAGLTPTTDSFMQAKSSAWASRTPTQVTADLIPVVGDSGSGGTKGLVPAPGAGDAAAGKFLAADGTFSVPSGSGGAPSNAHYLTDRSESGLSAEVNLGALATGLLFGTVAAGVSTISSKAIGTDVQAYDAELAALAGLTSAADKVPYFTGSGTAALADFTSTARSLVDDTSVGAMRATLGVDVQSVSVGLNNGTDVLGVGQYIDIVFEYACTINQVTLLADQSGSVVLDLRKCTYTDFDDSAHPVSGDSICASAKPTLSSATKAKDSTLSGWTVSVSAGDIIRLYVVSATTITQVTLSIKFTRA